MAIKTLYFNNLSFTLPAAIAADDAFVTIPADTLAMLKGEGLPDISTLTTAATHTMNLTLADAKAGTWEVMQAYAYQGEQLYCYRGAEGTPQAWPAGTTVYQALTAGDLVTLNARLDLAFQAVGDTYPYGTFKQLTFDIRKYAGMNTVAEWVIPDGEATSVYGADMTINEFESYSWHKLTILLNNRGGARQLTFKTDGSVVFVFPRDSGVSLVNNAPTLPLETDMIYRLVIENVATGTVAISVTPLERPVMSA